MPANKNNFNEGGFPRPLLVSPFIQHWSDAGINPPPPGTSIMITEIGENMITENGNYMITE